MQLCPPVNSVFFSINSDEIIMILEKGTKNLKVLET